MGQDRNTAAPGALAIAAMVVAFALLAGCTPPPPGPPLGFPQSGARLAATVYLSARGPDRPDASLRYPSAAGGETRLTLAPTDRRPMSLALRCDGPARLWQAGERGPGRYLRRGGLRRVRLPGKGQGALPVLALPAETAVCEVSWGAGHRLRLLRDGAPATPPSRAPACPMPPDAPDDPLARAFFVSRPLDQTCAAPAGGFALVPGKLEALKWRLDRLTGSDVPLAQLAITDPDMTLDFSHAPRFDEIIVSYLAIRADLSGWLTMRTLAAHAAAGTRIRIMTTASLNAPLDRAPLEALAAQYPNVSVQFFRFPVTAPGDGWKPLGRSSHVKLFLGLSPDPGRSFALVGGRNLVDGFFFDHETTFPGHPALRSYGAAARGMPWYGYFSLYDDFEIALTDRARVAEIAAQFKRYFEHEARHAVMRPRPHARVAEGGRGYVRHFISLPWADGRAQERFYVDLFDAAQREIFVVSPFTYPTPAIAAALRRAAARGVDVRIVTRRGADEPPALFTRALNARFERENRDRFRFRLYDHGATMLHAKIVLIDSRAAIVASSNLNRRSFLQDSENGLVFLGGPAVAALKGVAERYWAESAAAPDTGSYALPRAVFSLLPGLEQSF